MASFATSRGDGKKKKERKKERKKKSDIITRMDFLRSIQREIYDGERSLWHRTPSGQAEPFFDEVTASESPRFLKYTSLTLSSMKSEQQMEEWAGGPDSEEFGFFLFFLLLLLLLLLLFLRFPFQYRIRFAFVVFWRATRRFRSFPFVPRIVAVADVVVVVLDPHIECGAAATASLDEEWTRGVHQCLLSAFTPTEFKGEATQRPPLNWWPSDDFRIASGRAEGRRSAAKRICSYRLFLFLAFSFDVAKQRAPIDSSSLALPSEAKRIRFFFPNKNHRCASFLEWQRAQTEIVWFLGRIHKILESSPNEMDLYPRMYGFQQHIIPIWTNTNGYVWFTSLPKKKFLTFHSLAKRNNFHIEFVNIRLNLIFRNSSLKKQDQHKNEHLLYLEQLQIFYSMTRLSLFLHFIENSIVDKDPLLYLERWKTNTDRF